jgi:hypothetical protein
MIEARTETATSKAGQGSTSVEADACQLDGDAKSGVDTWSRHPLVVTMVGFLCAGVLGGLLTWWLNSRDHAHDIDSSIRNNAIGAVSEISDLVNERRARGRLVISAIERGAPEAEVISRKLAYDEAYIRWNSKIPGDLLRIRAGLHWSPSHYERYVDSLTNANFLISQSVGGTPLRVKNATTNPGLFSIMDACLTKAVDAYRLNSFTFSESISQLLSSCKFSEVYVKSIDCFALVAEELYMAVNEVVASRLPNSDKLVTDACTPPVLGQPMVNPH